MNSNMSLSVLIAHQITSDQTELLLTPPITISLDQLIKQVRLLPTNLEVIDCFSSSSVSIDLQL